VQDTTRASRMGAYFRAIPHWLYFTWLRSDGSVWTQVVIWLSGAGTAISILGLVVEIWLYSPSKRYRFPESSSSVPFTGQIPLDIAFTVCVLPGYFRSNVEQALYNTFSNRSLPNGQVGFFYPGNFTFGQPVYLSRIVAAAMQVPGVHWLDTDDTPPKPNHFQRWGQLPHGETAAGEIDMAPLEIAQLDNDPNFPENGRIQFFLDGGI
jgi:hypothetical protein